MFRLIDSAARRSWLATSPSSVSDIAERCGRRSTAQRYTSCDRKWSMLLVSAERGFGCVLVAYAYACAYAYGDKAQRSKGLAPDPLASTCDGIDQLFEVVERRVVMAVGVIDGVRLAPTRHRDHRVRRVTAERHERRARQR